MKKYNLNRRDLLRKLASLGIVGAMTSCRAQNMNIDSNNDPSLKENVTGDVISRDDKYYETWRQSMVWHLSKPARYPDWIVQAKSEQDVIEAIHYARSNNMKVATRSSGHNSTFASVRDGGVLINLSQMNEISINQDKQTANVQPGVIAAQMLEQTTKENLAFPAAHCPSVAMGGYLSGGGLGWNHLHWGGTACHSIRSAEIVLANGDKVHASKNKNSDLYWAVRGAGPGFFGAITSFELQLYPAPASILSSMYIHSLDNIENVTRSLDELVKIKDRQVEILVLLLHNPQAPEGTPVEQSKICMVGVNAYADSVSNAKDMLTPFSINALAEQSVFKDEFQPTNFNKLYNPEGIDSNLGRYAVDNVWTDDPASSLVKMAEHFKKVPSDRSHVLASYSTDPTLYDDASFSSVANHYIANYMVWNNEEDDEANHGWLKAANSILEPYSKGYYVNEVAGDRYPERIRKSFSKESWERLEILRKKYDPDGVFHHYLGYS